MWAGNVAIAQETSGLQASVCVHVVVVNVTLDMSSKGNETRDSLQRWLVS